MKKNLNFEINLKQKYIRYIMMYAMFFILCIAIYNDTKVLLYALIAAIMLTGILISFIMYKNKKMRFEDDKIIYTDMFGNEMEHSLSEVLYRKTDSAYRRSRYSTTVSMITNYKIYIDGKEIITINENIFSTIDIRNIEELIKTKKLKEFSNNIIDASLVDNPITEKDIQYEIKASKITIIANLIAGIIFVYMSFIMIILAIESKEFEVFIMALFSVLPTVYLWREYFKLKNNKIVYIKNKGFYKDKGKNSKYYKFEDIETYKLKKHWINDVYREIVLFMNDKSVITITNDSSGFFELLDGLKIVR